MEQFNRAIAALEDPEIRRRFEQEEFERKPLVPEKVELNPIKHDPATVEAFKAYQSLRDSIHQQMLGSRKVNRV